MFDIHEYMRQVDSLKTGGRLITNNFLSASNLEQISQEEESELQYNEKAVALFRKDYVVNRLYFHVASPEDISFLKELLLKAPYKPVVTDCVGKKNDLDPLEDALCGIGFETHVHMSRWKTSRINFISESMLRYMYESDDFFKAKSSDTDAIAAILDDTFDPYVSWLPTRESLTELINDGLIFCAARAGHIIAVACLQKIGRSSIYSYQLAVVPRLRSSGIGYMLWQYALSHFKDSRIITSWSDDKNTAINRLHEMAGFTCDGLRDYVLIWK